MKKFFTTAICLAATLCAFTSCDDDAMQGMALSGCWEGDFGMCYDYVYRGRYYTEYADMTDIQFYPYDNYYDRGYGYQVDFYDYGPWDKVYHSFTWEVRNGIIYLDYCKSGEEELTTYIRDYEMTNDYLRGYFGNTNSQFRLRKYRDYYNWTPYINTYGDYSYGYGYGYYDNYAWDDYYWARTRGAEADTTAAETTADEAPKMIRMYNRHMAE